MRKTKLIAGVLIPCIALATTVMALSVPNNSSDAEAQSVSCEHAKDIVVSATNMLSTTASSIVESVEPIIPVYNINLSKELQEFTYRQCVDYGIEEYYTLILAVMWQESGFVSDVISSTNDYGLMQINIINHESLRQALGVTDFLNAEDNIRCGVYILSNNIKNCGGNIGHALMSYNMGPFGAARLWSQGIHETTYVQAIRDKEQKIKNNI